MPGTFVLSLLAALAGAMPSVGRDVNDRRDRAGSCADVLVAKPGASVK
jgi:hypothetical protein